MLLPRTLVAHTLLGLVVFVLGCGSSPPPPPESSSSIVNPVLVGPNPAPMPVDPYGPAAMNGAPTAAVVRTRTAQPIATWYSGPEPCKRALRGDSPVAKACSQGGIQSARATMKDLVRQGKAAGVAFECDDCHRDHTDHSKLQPDAPEKFQRLLAVVKR